MKLKTLNIILAGALLIFCSCSDDYLDIENPNNLSAASFWSSETDVQQGLVATYAALQRDGILGGSAATQLPVRSDVGRPNNWNANAIGLNKLTFNENSDIVKKRWRDCYIGIYRANQVLTNINNIELNEATKTQMEAEARFLRGFFYYSLYRGYNNGSVIIHTTVPESRDDFYKSPSPAEDVYNLILSDLEFAYEHLPKQYPNPDIVELIPPDKSEYLGRATWGAAAAMLGKLHINELDYISAKKYFGEILDSNLYSLVPNIGDNFNEEGEMNSESIFEVAFSTLAKPGTLGGAADGPLGSEATSRAITLATPQAGGYRTIMPSYYMTMLFKNDLMDPTNPINTTRTGSAKYSMRASSSIAIADDNNTTLYQRASNLGGQYNNGEASYLKKFQNWLLDRESDQSISGINERVIRLADVMLLYAECALETGGISDALEKINVIRNRSGVVPLRQTFDFQYNPVPTNNNPNHFDFDTDIIEVKQHMLLSGQMVNYEFSGSNSCSYLPGKEPKLPEVDPTINNTYYAIVVDYNHIKLAATKLDALENRPIDFTIDLELKELDCVTFANKMEFRLSVYFDADSIMEHIMWVERPLELMFEGHDIRWEDLTRWGKVKEQYERLASKKYVLISKVLYEYDPAIHATINGNNILNEFTEAAAIYQPGVHNYFPIPSTEQNSNSGSF